MSIAKKIQLALNAMANKALDRLEDPWESLDYSYQRQVELLTKVRRDVAGTGASRARVEAHMKVLHREQAELEDRTGLEHDAGGERAQLQALQRKAEIKEELSRLATESDSMQTAQERLTVVRDRLQTKVETFRVRKESIKAAYTEAEAQTKKSRIWSGLAEEVDNAGTDAISYLRQCELLTQLRSGIEDVTASLESLDREMGTLRQWHTELEDQAGQAPGTGEDDLSQLASEQQVLIGRLIQRLSAECHSLHRDEEKLKNACGRLTARVQASRAQKEDEQSADISSEDSAVVEEAASSMPEKTHADDMRETRDRH